MKLSEDPSKTTLADRKLAYRLYGSSDTALLDLMQRHDEPKPEVGQRILCRHPYHPTKRVYVLPTRVEALHSVVWQNGKINVVLPTLRQIQTRVRKELADLRPDHLRMLNPTPYKVSLSDALYQFTQETWLNYTPIGELA